MNKGLQVSGWRTFVHSESAVIKGPHCALESESHDAQPLLHEADIFRSTFTVQYVVSIRAIERKII